MNMTLGCREEINKAWFYRLKDGTTLTKEEWTSIVKKHIKDKGHEAILDKITSTVKLWNKEDTVEEVALYVYAGKHCTDVQQVVRREKVLLKPQKVSKEQVCEQLMLGGIS